MHCAYFITSRVEPCFQKCTRMEPFALGMLSDCATGTWGSAEWGEARAKYGGAEAENGEAREEVVGYMEREKRGRGKRKGWIEANIEEVGRIKHEN